MSERYETFGAKNKLRLDKNNGTQAEREPLVFLLWEEAYQRGIYKKIFWFTIKFCPFDVNM